VTQLPHRRGVLGLGQLTPSRLVFRLAMKPRDNDPVSV